MTDEERSILSHRLASDLAGKMVKDGLAIGLSWEDIIISCETIIVIIVAACAKQAHSSIPEQFAQEMVNEITEGAHERVQQFFRQEQCRG